MTLAQMMASDKAYLTPADVAEVLGCHPHAVRVQFRETGLPFKAVPIGNRIKIPRLPFIEYMTGKSMTGGAEDDHQESI